MMKEPPIEKDVPLAPFTTFKIGGKSRFFCRVGNIEELKAALDFARGQNPELPVFILGGGSNILVSDDGFSGLVIKMEMKGIAWEEKDSSVLVSVRAAAGESWDNLVAETVKRKLFGMENLSGIPGTVGASVIQNIGAYGAEIKNAVQSVKAFDPETEEIKVLSKEDCQFDYRESFFKKPDGRDLIIIEVTYSLSKEGKPDLSYRDLKNYFQDKPAPSLQEVRDAVISIREFKFPKLDIVGTAGSFFKNPLIGREKFDELKAVYPDLPNWPATNDRIKIPAAWLLDKIGNFRGVQKGNVGAYRNQSLVLINSGDASAAEVAALAEEMRETIRKKIGITLEREVQYLSTSFFQRTL